MSYAHEDTARVEALADALGSEGFDVWWDRRIPAGRAFSDVIAEQLAAADCVLVVWSQYSVSSGWVQEEAERGRRREVLLPVLIDDVADSLPLGFSRLQALDLRAWSGTGEESGLQDLVQAASEISLRATDGSQARTAGTEDVDQETAAWRSEQKEALQSARSLGWSGDTPGAEALFERLAEGGYVDATFALHLSLRDREEAYDQALHWLRIAAKQIDLIAPGSLPVEMRDELQNDSSLTLKARPWSEDDPSSDLESLGDAYVDLGLSFVEAGRASQGERLIQEAAGLGFSPAEYRWGLILLERGETVEAERWIRAAADQGLDEALEQLRDIDSG